MAIKGKLYPKTTWAFQERPVASAKLNLWDDRIEAALEVVARLLSLAWGGGDGVLRGTGPGELAVVAASTPSRRVVVQPGWAFISGCPCLVREAVQSTEVSKPVTHPRRDLVQLRLEDWAVGVKSGVESAAPAAPTPDADCIALAHLHLRPAMTSIKDIDDGTNGYIIDARIFL